MVFFPELIFYLFHLKCSDWIYVKTKWCIEKDKTPEAVHLLKVSNKDTTGLFKVKIYDTAFSSPLITSNKCHKLPSGICCQLWAFFASKTFHSIWHCSYKTNIFYISRSFNSHFFIVLWLQQMCEILEVTSRHQENSFFFGKLLFLTLTSSNSKDSYPIVLKFSGKQID